LTHGTLYGTKHIQARINLSLPIINGTLTETVKYSGVSSVMGNSRVAPSQTTLILGSLMGI
jgi:hypothetical protein